jgi:hypothetical protein
MGEVKGRILSGLRRTLGVLPCFEAILTNHCYYSSYLGERVFMEIWEAKAPLDIAIYFEIKHAFQMRP